MSQLQWRAGAQAEARGGDRVMLARNPDLRFAQIRLRDDSFVTPP